MAYALDDEEEKAAEAAPAENFGSAAAPAGGAGGQQAQGQPAQKGGSFVGFDRYLAANKDAATATGGRMVSEVGDAAGAAKKQVGDAVEGFKTDASAGGTRSTGSWGLEAPTRSYGLDAGGKATMDYAPGGPVSVSNAEDWAGATYTGPESLEEYSPGLAAPIQKAAGQVDALGSSTGRQALLQSGIGRGEGSYTEGQGRFDSALVDATAGGRFKAAGEKFGGLKDYLGEQRKVAQNYGAARKAETGDVASYWQGELDRYNEQLGELPTVEGIEAERAAAEQLKRERDRDRGTPISDSVQNVDDEKLAFTASKSTRDAWYDAGMPPFDLWYHDTHGGQQFRRGM